MQLHNQHVIDALNHECDRRIKELPSDSPHADAIFYSFQDAIDVERADQELFLNDQGDAQ